MLYFKPIFIIIVVIFITISLYSCDLGARRYADLIREISLEYGVDPAVVLAVSEVESHFDPEAKSSAGAVGLMQLMPDTASWVAKCIPIENYKDEDLFVPETNVRIGVWYLSYLYRVFDESWQVFAAYNAGEGTVKDWISDENFKKEDIPYSETANYVKKVERALKRYGKKKFAAFD